MTGCCYQAEVRGQSEKKQFIEQEKIDRCGGLPDDPAAAKRRSHPEH